jgi:hypothetical protein
MTFLLKTPETKIIFKLFCEAFLIFKKLFCLKRPLLIFTKNKMDLFMHTPQGSGLTHSSPSGCFQPLFFSEFC